MERVRLIGTVGVILAVLVAAVGCGAQGGAGGGALSTTLPAELADLLAERSDTMASQLDAGDGCGAKRTLGEIRAELARAAAAGDVPDAIAEQIEAVLARLDGLISCAPAPEPKEPEPAPKPQVTTPTTPTVTQPPPPPPEGGGAGP